MEKLIYSSNSQQAILKDNGPFKIFVADNSISGSKIYKYDKLNNNIITYNPKIVGNIRTYKAIHRKNINKFDVK